MHTNWRWNNIDLNIDVSIRRKSNEMESLVDYIYRCVTINSVYAAVKLKRHLNQFLDPKKKQKHFAVYGVAMFQLNTVPCWVWIEHNFNNFSSIPITSVRLLATIEWLSRWWTINVWSVWRISHLCNTPGRLCTSHWKFSDRHSNFVIAKKFHLIIEMVLSMAFNEWATIRESISNAEWFKSWLETWFRDSRISAPILSRVQPFLNKSSKLWIQSRREENYTA
jgi:hypothetical protein